MAQDRLRVASKAKETSWRRVGSASLRGHAAMQGEVLERVRRPGITSLLLSPLDMRSDLRLLEVLQGTPWYGENINRLDREDVCAYAHTHSFASQLPKGDVHLPAQAKYVIRWSPL